MERIEVFKEEIKEYEKLKIISELAPIKEYLRLLEQKYQCSLSEFVSKILDEPESFEKWDDYIEWKSYQKKYDKLKDKMGKIDNATDIRFI